MALGFFRRRQKMVLVIMVFLMVAFLIQGGIRGLFEPKPHKEVIGRAGEKNITLAMQWTADADIKILSGWLGMGRGQRPGEGAFVIFQTINAGRQPELAWALLLHEAGQMRIRVAEQEVENFLAASGLSGERYRQLVAQLARQKLGEKDLRRAVANYLTIIEALRAGLVNVPPSMPEVRTAYRDLQERIQLGMVVFRAEDFTAAAAEPTAAQIGEWFTGRKHLLPDVPGNKTPFGFGYRQPDRADVAWLFIDQDRLTEAVKVPERLMREYWLGHKGELTKEVPIPTTATAPATTQPAETQPTQPGEPAEPRTRTVPIEKYSEAKPLIRQKLRPQVAEQKLAELIVQAKRLLARHAGARDPYQEAFKALAGEAEPLLGRKVGKLALTSAPLDSIIEQLENITGVSIAFPYGEHEKLTIDRKVVVPLGELKADATLGQALEKIRLALKLPGRFTWKTLKGLEDAVFLAEPVNLLPVKVGRTGMVDFRQLARQEPLGWAGSAPGGGDPLMAVVASAEAFQGPERRRTPLIEVGRDFRQAMYVTWPATGRLLWRLMAAQAEHEPTQITPAIRRQVIRDMKMARAFENAHEAARTMQAQVETGKDLEELAKAAKREFIKTDPFPRKRPVPRRGIGGLTIVVVPTSVPQVGANPDFLKQAFALVPADPDDRTDPGPADIVPLRRARKLLLIQRIGYEPPTEDEFDKVGLYLTVPAVMAQRQQAALITWFAFDSIRDRLDFHFKRAGD